MIKNSYRDILKGVLVERQKVNSAYSLRAFAQSLELSNSQLSRVLNEKQGLSVENASKVADRIGLSQKEKEIFCLLVQSVDGRSKADRDLAQDQLIQINSEKLKADSKELGLADYEILREWYNIAILELMDTVNFQSDMTWIAKEIGITPFLVQESVKKLIALGIVEKNGNELSKTQKILKIDKSKPSDLMKAYYDQLLRKAKESIYLQPLDQRHLSSVTVALDESDLETLNKEIDKFRSKFNSMAEDLAAKRNKKRTLVYCLTTQFFKINTGVKS